MEVSGSGAKDWGIVNTVTPVVFNALHAFTKAGRPNLFVVVSRVYTFTVEGIGVKCEGIKE